MLTTTERVKSARKITSCYSAMSSPVRPSVCPSVRHTGGSVEVRIMQRSAQSSTMTL